VTDQANRRRAIFFGDKIVRDVSPERTRRKRCWHNMPFPSSAFLKHRIQDNSYMNNDENQTFIPRSTFEGMFAARISTTWFSE